MRAKTLLALMTVKRLRGMTAGEFAKTWNSQPTEEQLSKERRERSCTAK